MTNETIKALLTIAIIAVLIGAIHFQELPDHALRPLKVRRRERQDNRPTMP